MDPLAPWWGHVIGVHRLTGGGTSGGTFTPALDADPDEVTGFWNDGNKLVRDQNGQEVVSSAQFAFPPVDDTGAAIAAIPAGSIVIAPPLFGSRQTTVITSALGDGAGMPTPNHYEISMV